MSNQPTYPIYVISKGRYDQCLTADFLIADGADFHIVVEPQEKNLYAEKYGSERIYVLPFSNLGLGSIPARNWCWEHAKANGHKRHWILDDNMRGTRRFEQGKRIRCDSKIAFKVTEDLVDRYENVAIAGLNYEFFARGKMPPFYLNVHVYSCILILNEIEYRWRGRYNEDTDLCLQALAGGWCTVLMNAFLVDKMGTMKMKGGNTDVLYKGDGRLKMARSLERVWPGVVATDRRFQRPQHVVKGQWRGFDTQLIRRKDIDWDAIEGKKYDIKLKAVNDIKSPTLKQFYEDNK